jgi:hypothetical protein
MKMKKQTLLLVCMLLIGSIANAQQNPLLPARPTPTANCNCKLANIKFSKIIRLNSTAGHNYRLFIEVNTPGLKCLDFHITKLTINGKVLSMPMTLVKTEEMAPANEFKLFVIDVTMPVIAPDPALAAPLNATATFGISGKPCVYKFSTLFYGLEE